MHQGLLAVRSAVTARLQISGAASVAETCLAERTKLPLEPIAGAHCPIGELKMLMFVCIRIGGRQQHVTQPSRLYRSARFTRYVF